MIIFKQPKVLDGNLAGAILGGAIAGAGGGLLGSWIGNKGASDRQDDAQQFSAEQAAIANRHAEKMYRRRYQWTVKDMKMAGLNPIMLSSGGFNVGSTGAQTFQAPSPGIASGFAPDLTSSAMQAAKGFQEISESESRIRLNETRAKEALANAYKLRAEKGLVTAKESEALENINRIKADYQKIMGERELNRAKTELTNQEKDRIAKDMQLMQANLNVLQRTADIYKSAAGKYLAWIKEVMGMLNINLGLIGGFKR